MLSCFVSWSSAVDKVMQDKQWDQGSLTFFHMQQTVPCAVILYSKASPVAFAVLSGLLQTLRSSYAFPSFFLLKKQFRYSLSVHHQLNIPVCCSLVLILFQSIENDTSKILSQLMIICIACMTFHWSLP